MYKKHYDEEKDAGNSSAPSTGPEIRSYGWNFVTEAVALVLVIVILLFGGTPTGSTAGSRTDVVPSAPPWADRPARHNPPWPRSAHRHVCRSRTRAVGSYLVLAGPLVGAVLAGLVRI